MFHEREETLTPRIRKDFSGKKSWPDTAISGRPSGKVAGTRAVLGGSSWNRVQSLGSVPRRMSDPRAWELASASGWVSMASSDKPGLILDLSSEFSGFSNKPSLKPATLDVNPSAFVVPG